MTSRWFRMFGMIAIFLLAYTAACWSQTNPNSFIYCLATGRMEEFAGRRLADGHLKFGLQFWNNRGNFLGLFGIARPDGAGWRYVDATHASGCEFHIDQSGSSRLTLAVKPGASCQDRGGYGTELDTVVFPASAYNGPVTNELDSQGAFFERTTGCGS